LCARPHFLLSLFGPLGKNVLSLLTLSALKLLFGIFNFATESLTSIMIAGLFYFGANFLFFRIKSISA